MIYILTNNAYLQLGVQTLLYPLQSEMITPCPESFQLIRACNEWDVLVIDTALPFSLVSRWHGSIEWLRVVFLSHSHEENIAFRSPEIGFHILNCAMPRHRFRQALVDAVTGNRQRYDEPVMTFTPREEMVFWASMKGLSIPDIASDYAISTQTAYNHRLRACQKLGIRKVLEALPLMMYFRAYQQKIIGAEKNPQKVGRLSGTVGEIHLRSPYLR